MCDYNNTNGSNSYSNPYNNPYSNPQSGPLLERAGMTPPPKNPSAKR